jgi:hypothetical protein
VAAAIRDVFRAVSEADRQHRRVSEDLRLARSSFGQIEGLESRLKDQLDRSSRLHLELDNSTKQLEQQNELESILRRQLDQALHNEHAARLHKARLEQQILVLSKKQRTEQEHATERLAELHSLVQSMYDKTVEMHLAINDGNPESQQASSERSDAVLQDEVLASVASTHAEFCSGIVDRVARLTETVSSVWKVTNPAQMKAKFAEHARAVKRLKQLEGLTSELEVQVAEQEAVLGKMTINHVLTASEERAASARESRKLRAPLQKQRPAGESESPPSKLVESLRQQLARTTADLHRVVEHRDLLQHELSVSEQVILSRAEYLLALTCGQPDLHNYK